MRISDWSSDVCSSDLRYQCAEGEFPFPVEWLAGCAAAGRAKAKPARQGGTISGGREAGFASKTAFLPESRLLLCDPARQRLEGAFGVWDGGCLAQQFGYILANRNAAALGLPPHHNDAKRTR